MEREKSGESIEEAIIVESIAAEYEYLERKFGERGKNWELDTQSLVKKGNKYYDRIDLKLSDGTRKTIYFDITAFFGER